MSDLKQPPKSLFLQFFTVNAKYYGEREGTIRSKISLLINPVKCKAADCLRSEFFVLLEFAWPITSCVGDDPSWLKELVRASVVAVHWNSELWTTSHQIEIATKCNMSCLADITSSHWIKPRVLIRAEIKHIFRGMIFVYGADNIVSQYWMWTSIFQSVVIQWLCNSDCSFINKVIQIQFKCCSSFLLHF